MTFIVVFFSSLLIALYSYQVLKWVLNWHLNNSATQNLSNTKADLKVSVVVAVRNEEHEIEKLLNCLSHQTYNKELLEVIISDDFSEDNTVNCITNYIHNNNNLNCSINIIQAKVGDEKGKKSAIERAVRFAKSDLIITTDADCLMGPDWIKSIVGKFNNPKIEMVTGFVKIHPCKNLWEKFQALEFISLSATGAASVISRRPLMCNGANLAFLKSSFLNDGGYKYGKDDPSGDDTYFMLELFSKNPNGVIFNNSKESVVWTKAVPNLMGLLEQRVRWASKVKKYKESYIKITGLLLFAVNLLIVLFLLFSFIFSEYWVLVLGFWLLKLIVDFIFILPFTGFANQRNLLFLFLPLQLIYPFYSLIGGIISLTGRKYRWKGRAF